MKKYYVAVMVLALSLMTGVTVMAREKAASKSAKNDGCSSCNKKNATPEQFKKFKIDSLDLRQELMNKRFDLQRETLKDTPDSAKATVIKAEIEAVKTKLEALKTAANLPKSVACGMEDCPLLEGNCDYCNKCSKSVKKAKGMDCSGKSCAIPPRGTKTDKK